jgi:hypothetical protein
MSAATIAKKERLWTAVCAAVAACALATGWWLQREGALAGATASWRLAFFATAGAVLVNYARAAALWRGALHTAEGLRRPLPFDDGEWGAQARLSPLRGRFGVMGRTALVGFFLVAAGLLLWLGGLGFGAGVSTGTMTLRPGGSALHLVRDGDEGAMPLDHRHSLLAIDEATGALSMSVEHPTTQARAEYTLGRGASVLFLGHRISVVEVGVGEATLRFGARWLWWWRVFTLLLLGGGAFLLLLVPHRSWFLAGRSGDYELRAWSLNGAVGTAQLPGSVAAWAEEELEAALGPERLRELHEVERLLAERGS